MYITYTKLLCLYTIQILTGRFEGRPIYSDQFGDRFSIFAPVIKAALVPPHMGFLDVVDDEVVMIRLARVHPVSVGEWFVHGFRQVEFQI